MILSGTLCLINTSLIYSYAISSIKISSIYAIKYPHLVNLSTMTSIILYINCTISNNADQLFYIQLIQCCKYYSSVQFSLSVWPSIYRQYTVKVAALIPYSAKKISQNADINLGSLFNIILSSTLYLINTSLTYTCTTSSAKISSVYTIKYPYLVNLSTITSIILCVCPITRSFNFSNFIIKSYNITSYSLFGVSTSYSFLYNLYLLNLFL